MPESGAGLPVTGTSRLLFAVTVPVTAKSFLLGQLRELADGGHEVHLVSSPGLDHALLDPRVTLHEVVMSRDPSLVSDLRALVTLVLLLRRVRPQITVVGTPKAGLLVGLAALATRVPRRFYLLRGLRLEGTHGPTRLLLTVLEVLACRAAHRIVAVSPSLADEVLKLPGVRGGKVLVVGAGSSNGVDTQRFSPAGDQSRAEQRGRIGVDDDAVVVGFVGRLTADKGLVEFLAVAEGLSSRRDIAFLVVGDLEGRGDQDSQREHLARLGIRVTGYVQDPAPWYAALDLLVLPTHREGFPNVVLEAGASGVPAVTTRATGARDSVVDGSTGLLVPARDAPALQDAVLRLVDSPDLRHRMGTAARERVLELFDQGTVWRQYGEVWLNADMRRNTDARCDRNEVKVLKQPGNLNSYRGKRLLDLTLLAVLAPLALTLAGLTAAAVRLRDGSPVMFRQERVGRDGESFVLLKFRTMRVGADRTSFPSDDLITANGRFLRRTSLDEIPQLWNIARGDMSWVGPRPTLRYQVERYDELQLGRLAVLPGLTGLAQVRGRNQMPWADRIHLDLAYVRTSSVRTDLRIVLATVGAVLSGRGSGGHPTADPLATQSEAL